MSIPESLKGKFAYHFTHVDNLTSIVNSGLLCTNLKNERNINHEDVSEESIQGRRSRMRVPCASNSYVHDYVPFYFSKKTPMQLGIINKKNVDQPFLIYFAIPIEYIESIGGAVFCDASANTENPPNFYNYSSINMLNSLNWDAINSRKWGCPSKEYRHQKMAELLIPRGMHISQISFIVVWNQWVRESVEKIFVDAKVPIPEIRYDPEHYYTTFYSGVGKSIVTGPIFLKYEVDKSISEIIKNINNPKRFTCISEALDSIKNNFCTIKELSDIDGLKASYGPHYDDVGTHTRKVAQCLTSFDEFNNLTKEDKNIVLLAAYLHDIGKGPKSRWGEFGMTTADNDHAVKSLPMVVRVLTEDIGGLNAEDIRKLVTLIAYDDLVGDIVAKGRNEKQLVNIIQSENDLNMLIALSKADMNSINFLWILTHSPEIEALRNRVLEKL